jgi:hypothetical protein
LHHRFLLCERCKQYWLSHYTLPKGNTLEKVSLICVNLGKCLGQYIMSIHVLLTEKKSILGKHIWSDINMNHLHRALSGSVCRYFMDYSRHIYWHFLPHKSFCSPIEK